MELSAYPRLSQLFQQEVLQTYFADGAAPDVGLQVVNTFLKSYPYYCEALIFKARMLIALERETEALEVLTAAKTIDEWRVTYAFEEAEILYRFGQKTEAAQRIQFASESLLREAKDGIENFLTCIDMWNEEREDVLHIIRQAMIGFLSGASSSLNLEAIIPILQQHVGIEETEE